MSARTILIIVTSLVVLIASALVVTSLPVADLRCEWASRNLAEQIQVAISPVAVLGKSEEYEEAVPFESITLERQGCFGSCPHYTLTFLKDGSARLDAGEYTDRVGVHHGQITPYSFTRVSHLAVLARGSFETGRFPGPVDGEELRIQVHSAAGSLSLYGNESALPPDAWALAAAMDALMHKTEWVSGK